MKGYDPDRSNVFYSRDVKFNELEFGLKECCNIEPIVDYVDIVDHGDISEKLGAEDTMPEPRRSQRIRHRPNYYAEGVSVVTGELDEPMSYEDVATSFSKTK